MTRSKAWPYNSPAWRKVRLLVLERDGRMCQIRDPGCRLDATEVDHVVSLHEGGAVFDPANLRAACRYCNRSRGGRIGAALTNTFGVSRRPSREW